MIPCRVCYCWFGGEKPLHIQKNIEQWKQCMPHVELVEINESNIDFELYPYAQTALNNQRYAFVSDVARLQYLYKYGGIYLDTDVEMTTSLDIFLKEDVLHLSMEIFGGECTGVNVGTIIVPPKHPVIKHLLKEYESEKFINEEEPRTINERINTFLVKETEFNYKDKSCFIEMYDIKIYPSYVFCVSNPKKIGYTIHHYDMSWKQKLPLYRRIRRYFGKKIKKYIGRDRFEKIRKYVKSEKK